MDKALIRHRFAKASGSYPRQAFVQRDIALRMADLIGRYVSPEAHRRVLEIGCGTGLFTRAYLHRWCPERLVLNDLCPEVEPYFADLLGGQVSFVAKDAEALDFPSGQDLIMSCSALQWFDAPERFLLGCRKLLSGRGYLAFSTFGPRNAEEIRALTDAGASLPSVGRTEGGTIRGISHRPCFRSVCTAFFPDSARRAEAPERYGCDRHPPLPLDTEEAGRLQYALCRTLCRSRRDGSADVSSYLYSM